MVQNKVAKWHVFMAHDVRIQLVQRGLLLYKCTVRQSEIK